MSDMNDNDHLMSRSTRDAHIEMERERDEARDKLEWHRQMADYHAKKRVETEAQRDALKEALREIHDLSDGAHISRARSIAGTALIACTHEALAGLEERTDDE